jgi:hypothetical protein
VAFRGVARQVVRTNVSFGFDNLTGQIFSTYAANEDFSQQIGSDFECGTGVERAR